MPAELSGGDKGIAPWHSGEEGRDMEGPWLDMGDLTRFPPQFYGGYNL